MIGLCIGLAVQAYGNSGTESEIRSVLLSTNKKNLVPYRRDDPEIDRYTYYRGWSYEYYQLLDACPLRMRP